MVFKISKMLKRVTKRSRLRKMTSFFVPEEIFFLPVSPIFAGK